MRHAPGTLLLAACLSLFCGCAMATGDLSRQEDQGRAFFLTGRTDAPPPYATLGAGDIQVPATAVPCASCHGRDGRGRTERGIVPPNITWPVLSAPYAASGRQRPPYGDTAAIRAITMGIDAGGNRLDPVMPRFHLSQADAAALLAYLKRLGTLPEPGLDDHTLVLGTVLGERDAAAGAVLRAYLASINQAGGLYGRQLELRIQQPAAGEAPGRAIARLVQSDAVFALLAPAIAGDERDAVATAEADGVPMVGPLAQSAQAALRSRYVFYLNGGVEAEARALAGFAATLPGTPSIVDDGTSPWHEAALAAAATLSAMGDAWTVLHPDDPALLARSGPILWFAGAARDDDALRNQAAPQQALLLPSALATGVLAHAAGRPIWIAFTAGPSDITADAAAEYRDLAARYGVARDDQPAQRQALAAAKVIVEALRRAGRTVTRERLVDALESLQDFHTGLIPPVSYSATRRIGTDGVWIVRLGDGTAIWWDR